MRERLVVVGNGMAGSRTVEEILARGGDARFGITVFGAEPHPAYNRILLSGVLAGTEDEADVFLAGPTAPSLVRLHTGTKVTRVDRDRRLVHAADGTATPYDVLVLATGSRPHVPPPLAGAGGTPSGVFCFRDLDDARRMIRHARGHRRAVVVGGGLLGVETARGLQSRGLAVTLVHSAGHLLDRQLDRQAGKILARSVAGLGITVLVGARPQAIVAPDRIRAVRLDDGRTVGCDMVVVAAGVRPETGLAEAAGLPVERGILVDDQLRTADPRVYAVGECAQHRGRVYGLVDPVWEQAAVFADHLTGSDPAAAYAGSRTAAKLKAAGIGVASMGLIEPELDRDEHVIVTEPRRGIYRSAVVRDGRLVGATLLGDVGRSAALLHALDRGTPLPEERAALLVGLGSAPGPVPLPDLPDDEQVCTCSGVSKGAVVDAVHNGETGVREVMDATRAGRGCGSCRPLLERVVDWAAADAAGRIADSDGLAHPNAS